MTLEPLCAIARICSIYKLLWKFVAHVNRGSSRAVAGKMLEPIHDEGIKLSD